MSASSFDRELVKKELQESDFDVIIIGGGITGAGIALDAASRGFKTALIEKYDYASGTSSRSTKLIHGGLRYLKQFEIALVREVGRERAIVHKLAPHLVTSEKMLLPLTKDGNFGKFLTSIGLMVYDVLAGVESVDQRRMLDKEEALEKEPLLDPEGLEGAGIYAEYRTDDSRLTIEVIKTAIVHGAKCLNYTNAYDFLYKNEKVSGVKVLDQLNGQKYAINTKYVINATGPWVDDIRDINKSTKEKQLYLTKGVHLVVPHNKFPLQQAIYYDVDDGRMIFSIPRGGVTYIGTTDTEYKEDRDRVRTNKEDVDYLLTAVNKTFPAVSLKVDDVISSWAGVRPLIHEEGKSASEISRKDEIFESKSGLVSIAGGKLTGYRMMAKRVIDKVVKMAESEYDLELGPCYTDDLHLTGSDFHDAREVQVYQNLISNKLKEHNLDEKHAYHLVSNYGKQADAILKLMALEDDEDSELNMIMAEVKYTTLHEQTLTPLDYFNRRSGRLYFDIESVKKYKDQVISYYAKTFNKPSHLIEKDREELELAVDDATNFE